MRPVLYRRQPTSKNLNLKVIVERGSPFNHGEDNGTLQTLWVPTTH